MAKPLMCDPALLERDLAGKTAIVTGANSGIGYVTARQLARQGATVVLACRRTDEAKARVEAIRADHPEARVHPVKLDLADLSSVRGFAEVFLGSHERLDLLINNAGVMNPPHRQTKDGFELQIGVNHLGHFALTERLVDRLKASAPSRVVIVSSCFHDVAMGRKGFVELEDLHFERRPYDGWAAYAQSKLANVLHAAEFARRLEGTGVTAVSLHPGWVRTNLARHSLPAWVQDRVLKPVQRWIGMLEPWEGAQTTLHCALADDVPEHAGAYFSQRGHYRDRAANPGGWPMTSPNPVAHDEAAAARLWYVSQALTATD